MSVTAPFPHAVPPETTDHAMAVENAEERRSGHDRRESSGFSDPRLWVSVSALLLTLGLAVLGYISSQLSAINTNVQAIVISTAKQGTEIDVLKDQVRELQRQVESNEKAQRDYNYNLSTRLKGVEVQNERR